MKKILILLFLIFNISLLMGQTLSWGSYQDAGQGSARWPAVDKVSALKGIYVYCDYANPGPIEACVITVSGSTISFGGIETVNSDGSVLTGDVGVCMLDGTYFVSCYVRDASGDDGGVRAGSISGTTITLGDEVQFTSNDVEYPAICKLGSTKFLLIYNDETNSDQGTLMVGETSGTTITMATGDVLVFEGKIILCDICYITTDKAVIFYKDLEDNGYLKSCVVSVTGTVPSIGTIMPVLSAEGNSGCVKLIDTDKVVYLYEDVDGDDISTKIGSISGTSITLYTEEVIQTSGIAEDGGFGLAIVGTTSFVAMWSLDGVSGEYCYSNVCTVSENSISAGASNETIVSDNEAVFADGCALDTDKVIYCQATADLGYLYVGTFAFPGWTGTAWGVTNPATVFGKAVADIDKVWGQ